MDWNTPLMQDLDLGCVKIETEHLISGIGKTSASH
jgi:phage antirepressor YoqD-like protein